MSSERTRLDPPEVPADDRGFLLGDGLFETVRVYRGVPFRLGAHLERLGRGARRLGIPVPPELEARVRRFVQGGPREAALRITVTRGGGGSLVGDGSDGPRVALRSAPVRGAQGALAAVLEGRVHEGSLSVGVKGLGYLERILALRRARERGGQDALIRNTRGELVEGAFSNVLAVGPRGELIAPGEREGALPGITRGLILDEARRQEMSVQERGLRPEELGGIRELFLSSSIRELVPVVQVEGHPVGPRGGPGPVFRELREALRRVVEEEVAAALREGSRDSGG